MRNLHSEQIQQLLISGDKLFLSESVDASRNIPMSTFPDAIKDLDADLETVVICHHGARSLQVANYLENNGFGHVINLDGGVDAWAKTVDPDMQQY